MSAVFRVSEVYRPTQRRGPILVGETPSVLITTGTQLVSRDDPDQRVEMLGVDFPTETSKAAGRVAVVVTPDLGDLMEAGAVFDIVAPET